MADWQVGDLALCVGDPGHDQNAPSGEWIPNIGAVYTVSAVWGWIYGDEVLLDFAEDHSPLDDAAWEQCAFRKITPGAAIEGVEVEHRVPIKVDA